MKKSDKILAKRVLKKIEKLQETPVLHDSKRIEGSKEKLFRVRIGDYRILYEVDHQNHKLGIVRIDKISRIY